MDTYEWISRNKQRWALSTLRFAYYLTGILSILFFISPFYVWFNYLWPHSAYLLSGSASIYIAVVAVIYGICFVIATAVLIVLHALAKEHIKVGARRKQVKRPDEKRMMGD